MDKSAKDALLHKMKSVFLHKSVLLLRITSLSSKQMTDIKKCSWARGVECMSMKNSLAKIVAKSMGLPFLSEHFFGKVLVFYTSDIFLLSSMVNKFIVDYPGRFALLGGKYADSYLEYDFIVRCADISSAQSLYIGMLRNITFPVRTLSGILSKLADVSQGEL